LAQKTRKSGGLPTRLRLVPIAKDALLLPSRADETRSHAHEICPAESGR
jgi:hypothetical protein